MKALIYFTTSFPYGLGEMWKANELNVFRRYFDKITVVPFSDGGNPHSPKPLPQGIHCEQPLFSHADLEVSKLDIFKLFDEDYSFYFKELIVKNVFSSKRRFASWLSASLLAKKLKNHSYICRILRDGDSNTSLYFYWGRGSCEVLPLIDTSKFNKIVVRMHGYDLFEYRNNGYIPYRKDLLRSVTLAAPSSQAGYDHLVQLYPTFKSKIRVTRCGTVSEGISSPSEDGVLRIVTCSMLIPLKRIHLVVESLHRLQFPVEWTHIGDGILMEQIKAQAAVLPRNVKVNLIGEIDSRSVLSYYIQHPCDVFVNVSSTEGVPFSIMEALSSGVPVMATDVGGNGEIVDDSIGKLLPADLTAEVLANAIREFYEFSKEAKAELRKKAIDRYSEKCHAIKLAEEMAEFLCQ